MMSELDISYETCEAIGVRYEEVVPSGPLDAETAISIMRYGALFVRGDLFQAAHEATMAAPGFPSTLWPARTSMELRVPHGPLRIHKRKAPGISGT